MEVKKINFKILSLLVALMLIAMSFLFAACDELSDYNIVLDDGFKPTTAEIIEKDSYGNSAIKLQENRDIKVLQLTDVHIGNGSLSIKKDRKALQAVSKLIEDATPDLIVLTGDIVYPNELLTGSSDNYAAMKIVCNLMESYKTPWTFCFGNHDAEWIAKYSKSDLCDLLESPTYKYCLFNRGPEDIGGLGNHVVDIYNNDGSFNSCIIMLDNGEYDGSTQVSGYKKITPEQTEWYKNEITKLSEGKGEIVKSFVYFHVPLKEYEIAWDLYRNGNPVVEYYYGWANESGENISCPEEAGDFFQTAVELKSTKAMFCGHNHLNDFSIEFDGIRLTFGKSIDYIAYALQNIANKTEQRGSTTLVIKGLESEMEEDFDIYSTKLVDIS